jgi:RNA polymerase sigma-70 factor (ECF subfamily)
LFEVARNTLTDHLRRQPPLDLWSDEALQQIPDPTEQPPVVDQLTGCLRRVLGELDETDAHIIRQCDLNGQRQQDYAIAHGLSLPATKARLRRARERLRLAMTAGCQIQALPGGGVDDFVPR